MYVDWKEKIVSLLFFLILFYIIIGIICKLMSNFNINDYRSLNILENK